MGTHNTGRLGSTVLAAGLLGLASLAVSSTALAQGQMRDLEATGGDSLIGDAFHFVKHNLYFRFGAGYLDYYGTSTDLKVKKRQGPGGPGLRPR